MDKAKAPSAAASRSRTRGKQKSPSSQDVNHEAGTQIASLSLPCELENSEPNVEQKEQIPESTTGETVELTTDMTSEEAEGSEESADPTSEPSSPAAKKTKFESGEFVLSAEEMSASRYANEGLNQLTVKIMQTYENRQLNHELIQLIFNCHGVTEVGTDNSAPVLLTQFMILGRTVNNLNTMELVQALKNHPCKFARLLVLLYFVQDIKEHEGLKLVGIYKLLSEADWSQHVGEFLHMCLSYFAKIKSKGEIAEEWKEALTKIGEESHAKENEELMLLIKKAMFVAVNETEGKCTKCTNLQWFFFSARYENLLQTMLQSKSFVHPMNELLVHFCDSATCDDITVFCRIEGVMYLSYFIHGSVLSMWTGKPEKSRQISLAMRREILQTFIHLLYHDERTPYEKCLDLLPQIMDVSATFKIPNPGRLFSMAKMLKSGEISEKLYGALLRYPEAWINDGEILQLLDLAAIRVILASDDLNMQEVQVFLLCERWATTFTDANFSPSQLFELIEKLIRIPLISSEDFLKLVNMREDSLFNAFDRTLILSFYLGFKDIVLPYNSKPRNLNK